MADPAEEHNLESTTEFVIELVLTMERNKVRSVGDLSQGAREMLRDVAEELWPYSGDLFDVLDHLATLPKAHAREVFFDEVRPELTEQSATILGSLIAAMEQAERIIANRASADAERT